MAGFIEIHSDQ